jgi:lambda repressor-like predicted transcriptional regulator
MTSTISDKDKGAVARLKAIAELGKRAIDVGVLGAKASAPSPDGEGLTVADVATFNEFGVGVPERSFIRGYVDEKRADVIALLQRMGKAVVAGKITADVGYEALALKIAANMQERIVAKAGDPKPWANAEATKKAKGSSTPLVDTGQLRSAIVGRQVAR